MIIDCFNGNGWSLPSTRHISLASKLSEALLKQLLDGVGGGLRKERLI
jgi:hypothetical protein